MQLQKQLNPQDTCLIIDFDGTVIKKVVNGQRVNSLMSQMINERYLGADGVAKAQAVVAKYYPIELNHTLSPEEKSALMQEWWEASYQILRESKLTLEMVHEVCDLPTIQLREGVERLFSYLHSHQVPVIIYSASGLGTVAIEYILSKHGLLSDTVSICSNRMVFDKNGYFSHVEEPIIHSANKTGHQLVKMGYITDPPARSDCLLIGDSLDDILMASGAHFEHLYSVVFADATAPKFSELFDLVLPLEGGYSEISQLFRNTI